MHIELISMSSEEEKSNLSMEPNPFPSSHIAGGGGGKWWTKRIPFLHLRPTTTHLAFHLIVARPRAPDRLFFPTRWHIPIFLLISTISSVINCKTKESKLNANKSNSKFYQKRPIFSSEKNRVHKKTRNSLYKTKKLAWLYLNGERTGKKNKGKWKHKLREEGYFGGLREQS